MIKTRLIKLLSHAKKYIFYQVGWQWASFICQVVMIYSAASLLEGAFLGTLTKQFLYLRVFMVAAALVLRFAFDKQASYASFKASSDVKRVLREKIYEKLLKLGASYRENVATSEVVQMTAEGVEQLETYFGRYLPQLFYSLLAPFTLFILLSFISFKASLVLLICVPLIPMSIVAVQKFAKKLLNKYWGIYTELGDSFLENLQGLTTLKIYQSDQQKADEMDVEAQRFRKITMKVLTMQLNSTSVMDIMAYGGAAVGMIVTVSEFVKGNIGLCGALMMVLLASEFFIPLRVLGSFFHIAMNGMAASDKIFNLLDLPEPEEKGDKIADGPVAIKMTDVHFSYEEERGILKGISMEFPAGSFTSLVGTSGCGKSTIAGILMGRNKGYEGSVAVQGLSLSEINEKNLMEHVTMISHNSYLFKGTVRENLLMGLGRKENVSGEKSNSDEAMWEALEKVNLAGFLKEQQGLDTPVAEKGGNFSGGQCQRLALARALHHDSPVYIFDEATSNIDMESEEMIMNVIHELARTKTVILISHRLANVVNSDRIYMLKDGVVAQEGTHDDLMKLGGAYAELFQYQKELESYGMESADKTKVSVKKQSVDKNGVSKERKVVE